MSVPVIRQGDRVLFARASEHPAARKGVFLVEEVVAASDAEGRARARIVPAEGGGFDFIELVDVASLKHDPHGNVAGDGRVLYIEATIARGYLGDPMAWCWWETEYPEDGSVGAFRSREEALASIAGNERRNEGKCHFHVSELRDLVDEHYHQKHPQLRTQLSVGDARQRMRGAGEKPRAMRSTPAAEYDKRRSFTVDMLVSKRHTIPLRITLVGAKPMAEFGLSHFVLVERRYEDSQGAPSWQPVPEGGSIHNLCVYWLLRRLVSVADTRGDRPIDGIGTIVEEDGLQFHYTFSPSEDQ